MSLDRGRKQISRKGKFYYRVIKGRMIKPAVRKGGSNYANSNYPYPSVCMVHDEKRRSVCIHILVAENFIGPRPEGMVIDHLNENPCDNRASNLRYVTKAENLQKALVRKYGKLWLEGKHFVTSDAHLYCESCGRKY